jgi:hypothetical protein
LRLQQGGDRLGTVGPPKIEALTLATASGEQELGLRFSLDALGDAIESEFLASLIAMRTTVALRASETGSGSV